MSRSPLGAQKYETTFQDYSMWHSTERARQLASPTDEVVKKEVEEKEVEEKEVEKEVEPSEEKDQPDEKEEE